MATLAGSKSLWAGKPLEDLGAWTAIFGRWKASVTERHCVAEGWNVRWGEGWGLLIQPQGSSGSGQKGNQDSAWSEACQNQNFNSWAKLAFPGSWREENGQGAPG